MSHYLMAPNAFKHALSAMQAAEAVARGILKADPSAAYRLFPVGDGGDGTGELILQHRGGSLCETQAHDPIGRIRTASYGLMDGGGTAVIELASASGLNLLKDAERDPMVATTFGTGTLIRDALDKGVEQVIVCVGGSATVDGGIGLLRSLGIRFLDADGREILRPSELHLIDSADSTYMHKRILEACFTVLCDVRNPLLGPNGSAAVFGPQKGASPQAVDRLEQGLHRFAEVVSRATGVDVADMIHGGAAGGAAAGMHAFLGARLVSGIESFLDLTGFEEALQHADVVVTGEGSLDAQTLEGKGPFGVAQRAKRAGRKVVCLAGGIDPSFVDETHHFDEIIDINERRRPLEEMIRATELNLERAGERIASLRM